MVNQPLRFHDLQELRSCTLNTRNPGSFLYYLVLARSRFSFVRLAWMAELADALHSGCSVRKGVQVRLLFQAPATIRPAVSLPVFAFIASSDRFRLYQNSTFTVTIEFFLVSTRTVFLSHGISFPSSSIVFVSMTFFGVFGRTNSAVTSLPFASYH